MELGRKEIVIEGFPENFKVQRIGVNAAKEISELPAAEIAKYFREHPEIAKALLNESYDKRHTPSTFIEEKKGPLELIGLREAQNMSVSENSRAWKTQPPITYYYHSGNLVGFRHVTRVFGRDSKLNLSL